MPPTESQIFRGVSLTDHLIMFLQFTAKGTGVLGWWRDLPQNTNPHYQFWLNWTSLAQDIASASALSVCDLPLVHVKKEALVGEKIWAQGYCFPNSSRGVLTTIKILIGLRMCQQSPSLGLVQRHLIKVRPNKCRLGAGQACSLGSCSSRNTFFLCVSR